MRSDETIFTGIALGEVPCPAQQDCPNGTRAPSTEFAAYPKEGVGWMVAGHESMDDLVECVAFWSKNFLVSWIEYHFTTVYRDRAHIRSFLSAIKGAATGKFANEEGKAWARLVKRMRLYACDSQDELRNILRTRLDAFAVEFLKDLPDED